MRGAHTNARRCCRAGLALSDHPGAQSVNLTFLAATDADLGDLHAAADHIQSATSAAEASGDLVRILYGHAHAARIHLMRKDIAAARTEVTTAFAAGESMQALTPWLMTMLAEVETAESHLDEAREHAEVAATLATVTDITWQRALALRAIGLIDAVAGDTKAAVTHLTDALSQARRTGGEGYTFHWPIAFILDSLVDVTTVGDPSASRRWAVAMLDHATAIGMNQFADRARARLTGTPPIEPV